MFKEILQFFKIFLYVTFQATLYFFIDHKFIDHKCKKKTTSNSAHVSEKKRNHRSEIVVLFSFIIEDKCFYVVVSRQSLTFIKIVDKDYVLIA